MKDAGQTPKVVIHYGEPPVNPAARPFPVVIPPDAQDDEPAGEAILETQAEAAGQMGEDASETDQVILEEDVLTAEPAEPEALPAGEEPPQPVAAAPLPVGSAGPAQDDPGRQDDQDHREEPEKSAAAVPPARFAATRAGEEGFDLLVLDGDGEPRPLTTGGRCVAARPQLSPDGRRVAYLARDGTLRVYDLDRNEDREVAETGPFTAFNWSRDGAYIAMDGLRVVNIATGEVIPVDHPGSWPVWLPDGRHLLAAWEHKLWVVDWTTAESAPVEDMLLEPRRDLQVSRDGRYAAYVSPAGSAAAVRVVDLVSREAARLDTGSDRVLYPAWSPQDDRLLVTATFFADVDGRVVRLGRITAAAAPDWSPEPMVVSNCLQGGPGRWFPGGDWIAFISCGEGEPVGGQPALYAVPAAGGAEPRLLLDGPVVGFDVGPLPAPGG